MNRSTSYPAEVRERAVRMVIDRWQEYDSQWAAIRFIAGKLGMSPETLRLWVRRAEIDTRAPAGCDHRREGAH